MAADTAALVALLQHGDGVPVPVADIDAAGGPSALLDARLGLFATAALDAADRTVSAWAADGISSLGCHQPAFPEPVRRHHSLPSLLLLRGELTPADLHGIAVIGTRTPSPDGVRDADELAAGLAADGTTIVSGLAAGIDGAAHRGALRVGGRTVAALATGLKRVHPAAHRDLQREVSCLVSAYLPDTPPHPDRFRERNALIAALSRATVIVDAGPRSGVRIEARHALAFGRRVVLFERVLAHPWAIELAGHSAVRVAASPVEARDALGR